MERAELGIDGNAAFALLGEDIQSGEVEFVDLPPNHTGEQAIAAAKTAFNRLKARLGREDLSYYFGLSHPWGD